MFQLRLRDERCLSGFGGTRTVSGQGEREHRQKLSMAAMGQGGVRGYTQLAHVSSGTFG